MSSTKTDNRVSFLRWQLNPSAAALWQLASKQAFQNLDVRASWIEIEPHWNPSVPFESEKLANLQESISETRPLAVIIGIERASLTRIVGNVCKIRELCNLLSYEISAQSEAATSNMFLIAWFPQADRESIHILRELGFDLVLHNPSSLRSTLTKIAQVDAGYRG